MSYILDSLKKSDEERKKLQQQSGTPYSPYFGHNLPLKKSRIIPALIITTFLLLATVILGAGWWYVNQQETEKEISSTTVRVKLPQKTVSAESTAVEHMTFDDTKTEVTKEESVTEQIAPTNDKKETLPPSAPNDSNGIPLLSELPFSTRSMIPEIKFRGHAYSPTPSQRMIMINTAIAREGDLIAPELTLEEITENGLIMNMRGTVFRIELF